MAIKIGNISVSLTAETASFQAGMDKASQMAMTSARNIERSFTMMGTAITGATTAAIGALSLLIEKTEDTVFQMQKMAQQAGVSIESFSKFAYAAKVAGMPTDQLATIMTRLAHTQFLAAAGSLEQAAAFKSLGVDVADAGGHFKTVDQLMLEVAKKLDGFRDSANKTGLETIIMGRSGAQAAELMNVLANRFDEISEKAEKLGVVFNMQTAIQSQKLHDSFVDLQEAGVGLSVRLLNAVSPALDNVAQKIVAFVSNADNMKEIEKLGEDIAHGIDDTARAFEFLVDNADAVKRAFELLAAIRFVGMFGPMIASASATSGIFKKLGIASLDLVGNLLGIRRMGNVFGPVASGAGNYSSALVGLARTEGVAATASYALSDALDSILKSTLFSTGIQLGAVVLAVTKIVELGNAIRDVNSELSQDGNTWLGVWSDLTDKLNTRLLSTKGILEALLPPGLSAINATIGALKDEKSEQYGKNHILTAPKAPGLPEGYDPNTGFFSGQDNKKDAPGIQLTKPNDTLEKRLAELQEKAAAAQRALNLVGALPQAQRDAETLEKYNLFLAEQKTLLDKLSASKREAYESQAKTAITTEVNAEASTKYAQAVLDLNQSLTSTTQEHLSMAAAIGKSAAAMQEAAVQAKVSQEMLKIGGQGWRNDPTMRNTADYLGNKYRTESNAENLESDQKGADAIQAQIDAQKRLNAAILQGTEARRQAQIITDQEAVRRDFISRGDTDSSAEQEAIEMVRKKSDAEKQSADLQRAASMDTLQRYQEQKQAIQDAIKAAEEQGRALDYRQILAADKEAWMQFEQAQNAATLATGSLLDGFKVALNEIGHDAESMAQTFHDLFKNAVNSINDVLANILTQKHQKGSHDIRNQFGSAFQGISKSLAKTGIQKAESLIGIGGKGKPDGSSGKPFFVKVQGGMGGNGSSSSGGGGSSSSDDGDDPGFSLLGWLKNKIQGAFANGTDSLIPGMPALVGEEGPELFVPPSSGAIVPNDKLKNFGQSGHTFQIDARGSTDPAQTVALIDQYMNKVAPQMAHGTIKKYQDDKRRRPPSSKY